MKAFIILLVSLVMVFSAMAETNAMERFCPYFSTNMPILWQAPIQHLPRSFWVYQRLPPRPFSAKVIHDAMVLALLQKKGFPKPATNDFNIWEDKGPNYPGPIFSIFGMSPTAATIYYGEPNPGRAIWKNPTDDVIVKRARAYAVQLGIDPGQITLNKMTSEFNVDENNDPLTNQLCGRGVYLCRQLDGVLFGSIGNGEYDEGFWIEFGSRGEIRGFSLNWPDLKRYKNQATASPQEMIRCLRAQRMIVIPGDNESRYFERIKTLSAAKKFTITKITPYYGDDNWINPPTNNEPAKFIVPFAEMEAVADLGNRQTTVQLVFPILKSEITHLLSQEKAK